jgi:hypothetical protein
MTKRDILRVGSRPSPSETILRRERWYKPTLEQIALSAQLLLMEIERNSKEEKEARKALAHIVMHHVDSVVGVLLANAINPELYYSAPAT